MLALHVSTRLPTWVKLGGCCCSSSVCDVEVPEINSRAAEPPYRQIAAWLRAEIESGKYRPGLDPLPSEKDLVDMFGVARDTVRRAVQVLRDEGLVVTIPQRGTYVAER